MAGACDRNGEYLLHYRRNAGIETGHAQPVMAGRALSRRDRGCLRFVEQDDDAYDGRAWKHIDTFTYDATEPKLCIRVTPTARRFWIAHVPPYTGDNLARLRAEISRHADFAEQTIGKTLGGRELLLWTIASDPARTRRYVSRGSAWIP